MLRKLAFLSMLAILVAVAFGAAASLDVSGGAIQYGMDANLTCDDTGVQVLGWGLETTDGLVYSVRIGGVDPECEGNSMFVRVEDSSGVSLGEGKILELPPEPTTGYNFSFVDPKPNAEAIAKLLVWIEGPSP